MNDWSEYALELLNRSLKPVPQELNELDWKTDLSTKSERVAQHISAFTNTTNGGFFVFGINNDGRVVGLDKEKADNIVQRLGNISRNNLTNPIGIDHNMINFEGTPILIVRVPESSYKPVGIRGENLFSCYKRSAGQTVKMTPAEIKQLIASSLSINFETQIAKSNLDDDQVLEYLDYDSYFRLEGRRLPDSKKGIVQALKNEEFINEFNKSNWNILNLGAILFCRDIDEFRDIKRKAVRVIVYKGNSRIDAVKEQVGKRGYATGFEGLINYIMDQLPTNEVIEKSLRNTVKVYPQVAIREFVANAIIHQDFNSIGSGVTIEIFADRMEITNPGVPLVDVNRFIDTAPRSRNEKLASLMRRLNICEERGSGIDRAVNSIEVYQLPAPKFIKGEDYTRVIIYAPRTLTKMSSEDRIRACYQHTCLNYVNDEPVNNQSVRKRFNIPKNNVSFASKIISETIESGLIKSSDPENASKKFASYIPYWA